MVVSCSVAGDGLDSLDLKTLLLTEGIFVHEEVYEVFGPTHHISPDPLECSVPFLPDGTVVHIATSTSVNRPATWGSTSVCAGTRGPIARRS